MVKNLVSYLYIRDPNNIEDSLGVNLRCIQKYYHIFDGIRVIYISTDFQISEPQKDEILRKIGIESAEFVINDPESRESKFFIEQITKIRDLSIPDSITFYHHSKGTTYGNPNVDKWASSMYYFNLNEKNLDTVEGQFSNGKIFVGTFLVDFPSPPWVYSDWHFSGTFFWFSNSIFNVSGWDNFDFGRFSVESYPGEKVSIDMMYNLNGLSNMGCDLRYSYYWREIFPNIVDFEDRQEIDNIVYGRKYDYKNSISERESAWIGHYDFAIDLVLTMRPKVVVELGVDWGFSSFSFAFPKIGDVYGIDWFQGDPHAGFRDTKYYVVDLLKKLKEEYGVNLNIIKGDFGDISTIWSRPVDILHIDGFHTYDAVSSDFKNWEKFLSDESVVLFHDVELFEGVNKFFTELDGFKLIRSGSCGLGLWTKNINTFEKIKMII